MDRARIKEIEQRCHKATKGPWVSFVEGRDHTCGSNFIRTAGEDIELIGASVDDQDFMASARQDIPWLINEVHRLKGILRDHGWEELDCALDVKTMIQQMKRRPQTFAGEIGELSLERLSSFIRGFFYGNVNADRAGTIDSKFHYEFHDWVRERLEEGRNVKLESGRNYVFYLSEAYEEPQERLDAFFELCERFFAEAEKG